MLNFWVSLESIWAVFVAGFVIFVEEQQITLFLDNLIVSLKVIFTVFSAEVEPRAWYMEELHIAASLLLYISNPLFQTENISFILRRNVRSRDSPQIHFPI